MIGMANKTGVIEQNIHHDIEIDRGQRYLFSHAIRIMVSDCLLNEMLHPEKFFLELLNLNRCRLRFQGMTLVEILPGNKTEINKKYTKGHNIGHGRPWHLHK